MHKAYISHTLAWEVNGSCCVWCTCLIKLCCVPHSTGAAVSNDSQEPSTTSSSSTNDASSMSSDPTATSDTDSSQETAGPLGCCRWPSSFIPFPLTSLFNWQTETCPPFFLKTWQVLLNRKSVRMEVRVFEGTLKAFTPNQHYFDCFHLLYFNFASDRS